MEDVGLPFPAHEVTAEVGPCDRPPRVALLENIRSIFNVGAIFRIADGAGMQHLYLTGITATPEHPKVAKTALGAETAVPWSYYPNGLEAAQALRAQNFQLWALEGGSRAVSLFSLRNEELTRPVALVAGNEVAGVDPGILELCERVVYIPMQGSKRSLNVAVAFGIAAYFLAFQGKGHADDG